MTINKVRDNFIEDVEYEVPIIFHDLSNSLAGTPSGTLYFSKIQMSGSFKF